MKTCVNALVLSADNRREADRLVWLLCDGGNIIRAYAGRARNPKSRMCAVTEPFVMAKFDLVSTSGGYSVESADIVSQNIELRSRLTEYALANYISQVITSLFAEDTQPELYPLFANLLHLLAHGQRDPRLLKAAAEFKLASLGGWKPSIEKCGFCGRKPDPPFFSIADAVCACEDCAAARRGYFRVENSVLRAISMSVSEEKNKLFSFTLSGASLDAFSRIAQSYLLYHTDMKFTLLDYYNSLCEEENSNGIQPAKTEQDG